MLIKHRAFSESAGKSIARGLAIEMLSSAHDQAQMHTAWNGLDAAEQKMPEVAIEAAERLLGLGGEVTVSRQWLLPVWDSMVKAEIEVTSTQKIRLVRVLELGFSAAEAAPDGQWLARIESAQAANPRDAALLYLAGVVCMRLKLWGKAQQMLKQSLHTINDAELRRDAWRALAALAEQRQDAVATAQAFREAAKR
jgi:HemY protein